MKQQKLPHRLNAALAIFRADGRLLMARRATGRHEIWQCPQGGIRPDETPKQAAWREMQEEIGTQACVYCGELPGWVYYDLPPFLLGKALKGKYCGQKQKWVLFRFTGVDADIDLNTMRVAEFSAWKWVALDQVLSCPLGFKKEVYGEIVPQLQQFYAERIAPNSTAD